MIPTQRLSSLEPATVAAFDAARLANAEILGPIDKTAVTAKRIDSILNSGASDAMDQALETAFPSQDEGAEVLARNGARVHWRKTSWSGLTVCGLDVDSLANGYDGPKCQECFPTTQRTELETIRDKVKGHLEAARMVYQVAYARGGTVAENRAIGAVDALEVLARDLGI